MEQVNLDANVQSDTSNYDSVTPCLCGQSHGRGLVWETGSKEQSAKQMKKDVSVS